MAAVPTIGRADQAVAVRPASADAYAEVLYERLYDRIFGYCLYQLGSREEAEDAAQVTFVQALRGLRRGVVPRVEAAWVFAIAKNVCLERHQVRGKRRAREVLLDPADLDLEAVEDGHGEEAGHLREALEHLPAAQREAVLLREWRGLSYREIATEMGLSLSAVETLIFRARRSLAQELSETTGRSRVAHGLLLGPLAAAVKVFAGSAAKVVVTAALAVAALTGGVLAGDSADPPRRPAVEAPPVGAPVTEPAFQRPAAAGHAAADVKVEERAKAKRSEKKQATDTPGTEDPGTGGHSPADPALMPAEDLVNGVVGGVVEPVLEPVEPLVDDFERTLDPVLDLVPQLPQTQLP